MKLTSVCEILELHSLISCECLLLFTSMSLKCGHGSDGVSTRSKLNVQNLSDYVQKYLPLPCIVRLVGVNMQSTLYTSI